MTSNLHSGVWIKTKILFQMYLNIIWGHIIIIIKNIYLNFFNIHYITSRNIAETSVCYFRWKNEHQYGFWSEVSTENASYILLNEILTALNNKQMVGGIFCNIHKAFDCINLLTPNDPYMGRTAPLTSKRWILYIYSTNIGTEYFKHAL